MKAIIFAAGLGTRIQKINQGKPKALLELNGKTLLEHAITYLSSHGVNDIIINVHHHAEMIKTYLKNSDFKAQIYISDESDLLLDTGGGLVKAKDFLDGEDFFIAYNVDIITNLNLSQMIQQHQQFGNSIATLAVRNRETSRYLLFDKYSKMQGWTNKNTGEIILHKDIDYKALAFSGIHIISNQIFNLIENNKTKVFSITKSYIELSKHQAIYAYQHDYDYWFDVGKPETYKEAVDFLNRNV